MGAALIGQWRGLSGQGTLPFFYMSLLSHAAAGLLGQPNAQKWLRDRERKGHQLTRHRFVGVDWSIPESAPSRLEQKDEETGDPGRDHQGAGRACLHRGRKPPREVQQILGLAQKLAGVGHFDGAPVFR